MQRIRSVTTGMLGAMSLLGLVGAAEPATGTAKTAAPSSQTRSQVVVVENFESYPSDEQLAEAWYRPPHGGGIPQTRDSSVENGGQFGLRVEYSTTASSDKFYSPICRVAKWDLTGCNALQFWLKPDGSGRALLVDLNMANGEGRNIHDLWDSTDVPRKGDTAVRLVTVPFAKLVKNAKYADSPDTRPGVQAGGADRNRPVHRRPERRTGCRGLLLR